MKIARLEAIVSNIRTLKDRSMKVTLDTQEMSPSDMADLFQYYGNATEVQLARYESDFKPPESPKLPTSQKTPAERLRSVLWVYWDKVDKHGFPTFDMFYQSKMEELINHFKAKLPIT